MWRSTASEVPGPAGGRGICILYLSERVLGISLDCCQISAGLALGCHFEVRASGMDNVTAWKGV